jgi:hypothetical protein
MKLRIDIGDVYIDIESYYRFKTFQTAHVPN